MIRSASKNCEMCGVSIYEGKFGLRRFCHDCILERRREADLEFYKQNRERLKAEMRIRYQRRKK